MLMILALFKIIVSTVGSSKPVVRIPTDVKMASGVLEPV
jgi:predicted polyphosphate/ATP-dependent NAD kinase